MTRFYQIVIAILAICLVVSRLSSCLSYPEREIIEHTQFIRVPYEVQTKSDTVTRERTVYKPVLKNGNVIHDTIYRDGTGIAISPETYCKDNLAFAVTSSRQVFKSGDSLIAKFTYPPMIFDFDFHPKADTTMVITTILQSEQHENPFGFHIGIGAVMGMDGTVRGGVYAGVGLNIY